MSRRKPSHPATVGEPQAMFTLKCVGCGKIENRPASECHEQPFCNDCYMPMTLEKVTTHGG